MAVVTNTFQKMGVEGSIAMRDNTSYIIFSILRSVFCGNRTSPADKQLLTESSLEEVIKLAAKHDIAHLVAYGVINNLKDEVECYDKSRV